MAGPGKRGRPSKGDRRQHTVRFPADLYETAKRAAEEAGYDNFQDYVVDVMARAHGQAAPLHPNRQERLPISA